MNLFELEKKLIDMTEEELFSLAVECITDMDKIFDEVIAQSKIGPVNQDIK